MKIYCISEGELNLIENGKSRIITCERIKNYIDTVTRMRQRDEWKTTGKGARFMGVEPKEYETGNRMLYLRSVGNYGGKLIYSTFIDGMGGMYLKDSDSGDETYVFANKEFDITDICAEGDKCVIVAGLGNYERHIGIADINTGGVNQVTEGFTSETHPFISKTDSNKIYYTAMGYARDNVGNVVEKSPCSICCYNESTGELDDIISDDNFDYIKPSDDKEGNLYYIKREYQPTKKKSNLLMDILLFPVRIVKAIGGFLSVFSMAFGGEPLRTGGSNPSKTKNPDERELFVEGNMIKAQKQLSDDSEEGIIPSGWELIKNENGRETVLKKGVMDYHITDEGEIVYSDGAFVRIIRADGKTEKLCKIKLANSITVI
ncbi:MAG: hypothetical protein IJF09_06390 [Ruminiclostridium sp.]|nr:hypothetical protein [Ruminiclostridium sp.]